MYTISTYDAELDQWVPIHSTESTVRVTSDRYGEKVVFETDDPEWSNQ